MYIFLIRPLAYVVRVDPDTWTLNELKQWLQTVGNYFSMVDLLYLGVKSESDTYLSERTRIQ